MRKLNIIALLPILKVGAWEMGPACKSRKQPKSARPRQKVPIILPSSPQFQANPTSVMLGSLPIRIVLSSRLARTGACRCS